jgi:hypothetical protein
MDDVVRPVRLVAALLLFAAAGGRALAQDAADPTALAAQAESAALAARIRALGVPADPKTTDALLDALARRSGLVRATAMVALLKTTMPECVERLREHGLAHADGAVRARAARACARLRLASAKPALRAMIAGDAFWHARAEAAIACGEMSDVEAKPALVKLLSDPSEKARLGAIDALGLLGPAAEDAVPDLVEQTRAAPWQLRVGALQALGRIGSMKAVEPLIESLPRESSGHGADEICGALKAITHEDFGPKPEAWWDWWERKKAETSKAPPAPFPRPWGVEIHQERIGFVVQTSASMEQVFDSDPASAKSLSRTYAGATKLAICRGEVEFVLHALDPRAHFSLVAFGKGARSFANRPVPSRANSSAAVEWLGALVGEGGADLHAGLRAALRLDEESEDSPDLPSTVDTITVLVDFAPTAGEIVSLDALVEWYSALNRYARMRTHVVAFAARGTDLAGLRALAESNGGRFTRVEERAR